MASSEPDLSLVIACFNEEAHLEQHVREVLRTLDACRFSYEVILVDDRSEDRTAQLLRALTPTRDNLRALFNEENIGRGGTVVRGMREARGRVVGFIDIDLEVHCRYVPDLVSRILDGSCDVATGHRIYKVSLTFSGLLRWCISVGYRSVARALLRSRFRDTETGFKFFDRAAILPVVDRCRDTRWFWDTEIMLESQRAGLRVQEIPVLFQRQPSSGSTLRVIPDTLGYLRAIRDYRGRRGEANSSDA